MNKSLANSNIAMLSELKYLLDSGDYQEVVDRITDLGNKGSISPSNADKAGLLLLMGLAFYKLKKYDESLRIVREAFDSVKGSDENILISELQSVACRCLADSGRIMEAEREYRDLISTYRRLDDTIGVIRSLNRLSRIHFIKGQYSRAIDYLLEASDYAAEAGDKVWRARIAGNLGTILNLSGEFEKAQEYLDESIELNKSLDDWTNTCRAYLSMAFAKMHLRKFDEASLYLDSAEKLTLTVDSLADKVALLHYRAQFANLKTEFEAAVALAQEALALAGGQSALMDERVQISRILAEALLGLGKLDEARIVAESALMDARKIGERIEAAACRKVLAIVAAQSDDSASAETGFAEATLELENIGSRYELAMVFKAWSQYSNKPLQVKEYRAESERILRSLRLETRPTGNVSMVSSGSSDSTRIIGKSPEILRLIECADSVADSDIAVLLMGETGVGKDMLAKYLHQKSSRRNKVFKDVNCGAIPSELAESEFFGHEKGAFTGANETRIGNLEVASGGTLFLNEVGELSLSIQAKLLTALDNKEFCRVGSTVTRRADFRLIAATNVDLRAAVASGRFRADLYYRLAAMPVDIPRLSARGDDIFLLFEHFIHSYGMSLDGVDRRTIGTLRSLMTEYPWPGNVRELMHDVQLFGRLEGYDSRSVCLRLINKLSQYQAAQAKSHENERNGLVGALLEYESSLIRSTLVECGGKIRKTAAKLKLPEATLRSKMKKHRIRAA